MCSENFVLLSFQLKMVKISYSSFVNFVVIRYREPMRLRNPIPETNTNPPPALWRTCFDKIFEILLKIQILILKTEQKSSIRQKKSTGLNLATFHGLNMLQSAVTRSDISAHGEANGAHQKTGADNVLNSQSSTRDGNKISEIKGKTVTTGKAVDKNTAACKNIASNTVTRSSVHMSTGQSCHVLQGLKELKDLHQPSLSSINDMISTMKSAMETITQNKTFRKRKRDEMSDSDQSSDEESIAEKERCQTLQFLNVSNMLWRQT